MTALRNPKEEFSFNEYLAWEETQQERHEYVGGVAHAMAGGIQAHHDITTNAFLILSRLFGTPPCRVYSQGFRVRIRRIKDERGYYPDVFVTCRPGESGALFNEEPCVIVEVLSESTQRIDLGEKFDAYTHLPSLHTYIVLETHKAVAHVFRRGTGWAEEFCSGLKESVPVRCTADASEQMLSMGELYRNVFP
ncbi:MAG: Uma2 family endonuclease [Panacagrimonas sp.]